MSSVAAAASLPIVTVPESIMKEASDKLVRSRKRRVVEALDEFREIKSYLSQGHKHLDGTTITVLNGQCQGIARLLARSYVYPHVRLTSLGEVKQFTEILAEAVARR